MFRRDDISEILPPGLCALCQGSELPMVDTLRQNAVAPGNILRGKQYVCTLCVSAIAEAFGIKSDAEAIKKLENKVAYWQRKAKANDELAEKLREMLTDPEPEDAAIQE
jgi:hypothetical protein